MSFERFGIACRDPGFLRERVFVADVRLVTEDDFGGHDNSGEYRRTYRGFADGFRPIIPDPFSVDYPSDDELEQLARPLDDPDALHVFRAPHLIDEFTRRHELEGDDFEYQDGNGYVANVYRIETRSRWLASPTQDTTGREPRVGLHIDARMGEDAERYGFSAGLTVGGLRRIAVVPSVNVDVLGGSLPPTEQERSRLVQNHVLARCQNGDSPRAFILRVAMGEMYSGLHNTKQMHDALAGYEYYDRLRKRYPPAIGFVAYSAQPLPPGAYPSVLG